MHTGICNGNRPKERILKNQLNHLIVSTIRDEGESVAGEYITTVFDAVESRLLYRENNETEEEAREKHAVILSRLKLGLGENSTSE